MTKESIKKLLEIQLHEDFVAGHMELEQEGHPGEINFWTEEFFAMQEQGFTEFRIVAGPLNGCLLSSHNPETGALYQPF